MMRASSGFGPALQDVACPQLLDPLLGKLKPLGKNFVGVLANFRNASAAQWRRLRQLDRCRLNRHLLTARVFDFRNQLAMPNLRIIENILDRRNRRMRNVGVLPPALQAHARYAGMYRHDYDAGGPAMLHERCTSRTLVGDFGDGWRCGGHWFVPVSNYRSLDVPNGF
jgi:hypothetical protein